MSNERTVTKSECIKVSDCGNYGIVLSEGGEHYELWKLGDYTYKAGYIDEPGNIELAIENHEEEVRYLMESAALEFSL